MDVADTRRLLRNHEFRFEYDIEVNLPTLI